jgi:hypothetical protein
VVAGTSGGGLTRSYNISRQPLERTPIIPTSRLGLGRARLGVAASIEGRRQEIATSVGLGPPRCLQLFQCWDKLWVREFLSCFDGEVAHAGIGQFSQNDRERAYVAATSEPDECFASGVAVGVFETLSEGLADFWPIRFGQNAEAERRPVTNVAVFIAHEVDERGHRRGTDGFPANAWKRIGDGMTNVGIVVMKLSEHMRQRSVVAQLAKRNHRRLQNRWVGSLASGDHDWQRPLQPGPTTLVAELAEDAEREDCSRHVAAAH